MRISFRASRGLGASIFAAALVSAVMSTAAHGDDAPANAPAQRAGLTADNLCLIVNSNDPASEPLAQFYAEKRGVPQGRIIRLKLPVGDDIPLAAFQSDVLAPVRAFLKDNQLENRVTCLVTFFGVPLRVGPRINQQADDEEFVAVEKQLAEKTPACADAVQALEAIAAEIQPGYVNRLPQEIVTLQPRASAAFQVITRGLAAGAGKDNAPALANRTLETIARLLGPHEAEALKSKPPFDKLADNPPTPARIAELEQTLQPIVAQMTELRGKAATSLEARAKLRELTAANGGLLRLVPMLAEHKSLVDTRETVAAFDSELACLWWPDARARHRWHDNPLHYRARAAMARPGSPQLPKPVMVMRIDAPTEPLARKLIETSIAVEKTGLKGKLAFDARGKKGNDAYTRFDTTIRRAHELLRKNPAVESVLDDAEPVFAPGAVADVALYCGWYSLRNYTPGMKFVPGAIGYHVASLELISLHNDWEKGWVRGLMNDGVVATLGAVAEPYLHSFPQPDEFYPLLATGKFTLAEAYWATNPLVSWMNTCIGDPLYKPYAAKPIMKDRDVPTTLRGLLPQ